MEKIIEIKFGTCQQTNEQIRSVYIKSLSDAIKASRGDLKALEELQRLVKVADWELNHLINEAYLNQSQAA